VELQTNSLFPALNEAWEAANDLVLPTLPLIGGRTATQRASTGLITGGFHSTLTVLQRRALRIALIRTSLFEDALAELTDNKFGQAANRSTRGRHQLAGGSGGDLPACLAASHCRHCGVS
jgi:hypothetical protein